MRSIAGFLVKNPTISLGIAALLSCLPVLYILSWAVVAFMTLQLTPLYGVLALLWTSLPVGLLWRHEPWVNLVLYVLLGNGLVWGLAWILRQTSAWVLAVELAVSLGVLVVLGYHQYQPNLVAEHQQLALQSLMMLQRWMEIDISQEQMLWYARLFGQIYFTLQVVFALVVVLIALMLGRIAQGSFAEETGAVRKELYSLYVGRWSIILLGLSILGSVLGYVNGFYILPVVLLPFIVSGISVVHSVIKRVQFRWLWLWLFYTVFLFYPIVMIATLVIVALLERYLQLRSRLGVTLK